MSMRGAYQGGLPGALLLSASSAASAGISDVRLNFASPPSAGFWFVLACAAWAYAIWTLVALFRAERKKAVLLRLLAGCGLAALLSAGAYEADSLGWWPLMFLGAGAAWLIVWLYLLEVRQVGWRIGSALLLFRLLAAILLLFLLARPVLSLYSKTSTPRRLVLLIDDSPSMRVADKAMPEWRALRLAQAAGLLPAESRPCRLEWIGTRLQRWRNTRLAAAMRLADQQQGSTAEPADSSVPASGDGDSLRAALAEAAGDLQHIADACNAQAAALEGFSADLAARCRGLSDRIRSLLPQRLRALRAGQEVDSASARAALERAASAYRELIADLDRLAIDVDLAAARRLGPAGRLVLQQVAEAPRGELLRQVVSSWLPTVRGKQQELEIVAYRFDTRPEPIVPDKWLDASAAGSRPARVNASQPIERASTDLAAALGAAAADPAGAPIAAVVLLSDGRHTGGAASASRLDELAAQAGPIFCVPFGLAEPPRDAAVVTADSPAVVAPDETFKVRVAVRLSGLDGSTVPLRLLDPAGKVLAERDIPVAGEMLQTEAVLSARIAEAGRHLLRLELAAQPGEATVENNTRLLAVDCSTERLNVLLIDDLPRWEFRYLKNLLLRDRTFRMQYVLSEPAFVYGLPPRAPVTAGRDNPSSQADRLPSRAEELFAFDAIVLGDVSPEHLGVEHQQAIVDYVAEHAGTLVLVAGKHHMPGSYANSILAPLIPVRRREASQPVQPRRVQYQLRPTPEAASAPIAALSVDSAENDRLWASLAPLSWLSDWSVAEPGSTVWLWGEPAGLQLPASISGAALRRIASQYAAAVVRSYGFGRVLYIATDEMWRLRHRAADKWHGRFWRQVLRWAAAGKLPSATRRIRLGTDRGAYESSQPVVVRARLQKPDLSPYLDAVLYARAIQAGKQVASARMSPDPALPGMYAAKLTDLPTGPIRIELHGPAVDELLADDESPDMLKTTVLIHPRRSTELADLSADFSMLHRIADRSGGCVVPPTCLTDVLADVPTQPVVSVVRTQWTASSSLLPIVLFAMLLTAEWLLRKRAGLA